MENRREIGMVKQLYTSFKVFHHHQALRDLAVGQTLAPIHIRLKPTNFCNQHCDYCTYGSGRTRNKSRNRDLTRAGDQIPETKMAEIVEDLIAMKVKAVTFSGGGEPLTYQALTAAGERLESGGVELSLITNGQLLDGPRAELFGRGKWVRVSLDSSRAEEYARLRNVPAAVFDQVIANLSAFAKSKGPDCVLGINFVIGQANYKRVYEAAALLKDLGADNVKFSALISDRPGYHNELKAVVLEQLERAGQDLADDRFSVINAYQRECDDHHFSPPGLDRCLICRLATVIAADQGLYLCHTRAYDSAAKIGDLSRRSFRELWCSEETRTKMAALRPQRDCRNFCVYEDRNQALEAYFQVDPNHVNFL